jgi:hypothetical protein
LTGLAAAITMRALLLAGGFYEFLKVNQIAGLLGWAGGHFRFGSDGMGREGGFFRYAESERPVDLRLVDDAERVADGLSQL